ncbi:hypothetical protein NDU88_007738 [Pleurodeles waltl]|uniref:Uncharacterized protein n=1 Tax=Pleurodeles waltl TaxID=8319 RepID=A0AAV7RQA8_PLEWA|nr:hypothetical protein NDU88_007738 [Pleurodeles waltl]
MSCSVWCEEDEPDKVSYRPWENRPGNSLATNSLAWALSHPTLSAIAAVSRLLTLFVLPLLGLRPARLCCQVKGRGGRCQKAAAPLQDRCAAGHKPRWSQGKRLRPPGTVPRRAPGVRLPSQWARQGPVPERGQGTRGRPERPGQALTRPGLAPPGVRDPQAAPARGPATGRAAQGAATRPGAAPPHLSRSVSRPIERGQRCL